MATSTIFRAAVSKLGRSVLVFTLGGICSPVLLLARSADQQAKIDVEEIKRVRQPKKEGSKSQVSSIEILGDSLETKLIQNIDKTLAFLKETVRDMPRGSAGRLNMFERIMNLSLEQAAYVANEEQRLYERAWTEWDKSGRRNSAPKLTNANSRRYWQQLYNLSKQIIAEFPRSPGVDNIFYLGSLGLLFNGQEDKAAKEFAALIATYPRSPVVADASFSLGEYYFDRNQFKQALVHFTKASSYANFKRYGWVLFKLGWCYFNLANYGNALVFWKKTVSYSQRNADKSGKLRDEALRDMIYAYAAMRKIDEAIVYYQQNSAGDMIPSLLKVLAETLTDQGEFRKALDVWRKLVQSYPTSKDALTGQLEIVALTHETNQFGQLFVELDRLIKNFGPESAWAAKLDQEENKETQDKIRKAILYHPKIIHRNSQKTKNQQGLALANRGYRLYLIHYPKSLEVAEISEYLADMEYFQKNYGAAGKLYLDITMMGDRAAIYDNKGKPKEYIHQRSAKNMIDSFDKDFNPELTEMMKRKPNFSGEPIPISQKAKNFIKSCELYTKWYPKDLTTAKNCDIYTGEIYYRSQDRKGALAYLWLIATKYSSSKEGMRAVETLIPLYSKNDDELANAAKKLLSIPAYRNSALGPKLRDLLRASELADIKNEQDSYKRGAKYEAQAMQYPKDPDADKIWNNAATDYLKAGAINRAIRAYEMIVRLYPKSVAYLTAILQLGKIYESRQEFEPASKYFLTFVGAFPREKETAASHQKACYLLVATHKSNATQVCLQFAKNYPQFAAAALENLITYLARTQQYSAMVNVIEGQYLRLGGLTDNQRVIALHRIVIAPTGANRQRAKQEIAGIGRRKGVSGEAQRYVGEIAFYGASGANEKFAGMRLAGGSAEALQGSIQRMLSGVNGLEKAYGPLFATEDSFWGVAAFYQLGFAYETFANKLANPPGINGAKPAEVKAQLKGSVDELRAKAKAYYGKGWETAQRFSVYSEWTPKIFEGMQRLEGNNISFDDWVVSPELVESELPEALHSILVLGMQN